MDAAWTLIAGILAGAEAVREAGPLYLPKYPEETESEYARRRAVSPWRPEFADALRFLASRPFSRDIGIQGDVSERLRALVEDIDGRGNSLTRFAAEAFEDAVAKGLHLILVDYPAMPPGASRAEERARNARPYWVQIHPEDIVALHTDWVGGIETITHLRYRECVTRRDGFDEVEVERVRVYEPGLWQIYERGPDRTYALVDEGPIARGRAGHAAIPVVPLFIGHRLGALRVRPPLLDLAHMQIELYQALSRQDEILTFAASPMLTANGLAPPSDGGQIAVGPKSILYAPPGDGANASWDYIAPDAANLAQIRAHVASVTADMRRLGMQPMMERTGNATATGRAIDAAQAHSAVQAWALCLKDALEQAFVLTAQALDLDATVECIVHTDFGALPYADAPLAALDQARARGDIARTTYWDALKRFCVLPADFDPVREVEALQAEPARAAATTPPVLDQRA